MKNTLLCRPPIDVIDQCLNNVTMMDCIICANFYAVATDLNCKVCNSFCASILPFQVFYLPSSKLSYMVR